MNEQSEKQKILLVEDEQYVAKLFEHNLKKAGYDVATANNGNEGFEQAKAANPDLIISDIMMPQMEGFELREKILKDPELKTIPFVFLTAKGEEDDILKGYGLDIEEYIVKTESMNVIKAKISSILKTKSKQRDKVINEIQEAVNSTGAKVIPSETPDIKGFEIQQWHQTYEGIPGGDFIDYVDIKDKYTAVILGDVMGKKWGAWNFVFAYAGYIRSAARIVLQTSADISASKLLDQINKAICEDEKVSEVFITLSLVLIDRETNTLYYSGAGDLPLIYKNINKNSVDPVDSGGILLGFNEDTEYEDIELDLNSNDVILIITDGILESRNAEGEQYGMERLKQKLTEVDPTKKGYFGELKKDFEEFTNSKFEDDVSLIGVRKL